MLYTINSSNRTAMHKATNVWMSVAAS